MRSPKDMQVIQIDITNACIHSCSNCTRLCGHHKKPFFMDWETFRRAVDSLEGYGGTIGVMGGEPTLHPQFERFANYLSQKNPYKKEDSLFIKPSKDFMRNLCEEETEKMVVYQTAQGPRTTIPGPGLWSSLNAGYLRHYEVIQDTFRHQMVNDHTAASMHQPVLVTRKELGIPDDEWYSLRDQCWIQNEWSAAITPKGAFFCEVAGALDMLFNGPGGWPIQPGWWRRKPEDFKEQLGWCELCGMALQTCTRDANEGIDDVSPVMYERIRKLDSGKVKNGRVHVLKIGADGSIAEEGRGELKKNIYLEEYEKRFNKEKALLYPKSFQGIVFYRKGLSAGEFAGRIKNNLEWLDRIAVVFSSKDEEKRFQKLKETWEEPSKRDNRVFGVINEEGRFGTGMNRAMERLDKESCLIYFTPEILFSDCFPELKTYVINPGTMHSIKGGQGKGVRFIRSGLETGSSCAALFHAGACALRAAGFDRIAQAGDIDAFIGFWEKRKRLLFSDEVFSGPASFVRPGAYYIIYGTSRGGKNTTDYVLKQGGRVLAYADSSWDKWGKMFEGLEILSPEGVKGRIEEAEAVVIASSYFSEIRPMLRELGIPDEKIVLSTASF